jgi:hypothetical protein
VAAGLNQLLKEMEDRLEIALLLVVKTKTANNQNGLPKNFIHRFGEHVTGILNGLDRVRASNGLLLALSRGQLAINGIRNADSRTLLYQPLKPTQLTKPEIRRRSAAVTRQLALVRAHGLLRKMPRSHRYLLSSKGRRIVTALLAACYADVEQLTKIAA